MELIIYYIIFRSVRPTISQKGISAGAILYATHAV